MTGGFTFDGVDINTLGLEYAPDLSNTYVYKPSAFKNHEQVFDGHDGGYYYGNTVQPKEFVLRCFYEEQPALQGFMTKLYTAFRRGRTGRLVFKKRPWIWYIATVYNIDTHQMLNYQNGIATITLRAYYPFGRCDELVLPNDETREDKLLNTAMLDSEVFDMTTSFADDEPITEAKTLLLYNPGTERCKVAIRIAGDVGTGVSVTNRTTGQDCRFVAITNDTCPANHYVQCDGLNGQTVLTNGTTSEPGFLFHDYGFIELDPGFPAYRDIDLSVTDNRTIQSDGKFTEDMLGRYIVFASGKIAQIKRVDSENNVQTDVSVSDEDSGVAQIIKLNEIYVAPNPNGGSINLTKLDFIYKPTFA